MPETTEWTLEVQDRQPWCLVSMDGRRCGPQARQGFEDHEDIPADLTVSSGSKGQTGYTVFRREDSHTDQVFATSIDIDPQVWTPVERKHGWSVFRSGDTLFGLWTSAPASWLAQDSQGRPLDPPYRELCTFAGEHGWVVHLGHDLSPSCFLQCCLSTNPQVILDP